MYSLCTGAVQTADVTAPVESAVAALSDQLRPGLEPAPAAQQLTAVQGGRGAVAGPPRRARRARLAVVRAEVRRLLKVHQVLGGGRFVGRVLGLQVSGIGAVGGAVASLVGVHHPGGAVEAVLQIIPHRPEAGQAHPAGAHRAGARHAVALAFLTHLGRHRLHKTGTENNTGVTGVQANRGVP